MDLPTPWRMMATAALGALALVAGACGGDDGAGVRTIDGGGGSISGSGSASGSGSHASGSEADASASGAEASGSGSGSEVAACVPGDTAGADTTVAVDLVEWAVRPEVAEVPAGTIAFVASTEHAAEPHELVIVAGDDPEGLPVDADGAVDESGLPEGALVGEIEAFPAGTTCEAAFDLAPGDYVLFCNIVETEEDGTVEAHYAEGMTTSFTVTG